MKGKILFIAGLTLGYVLGARAGRERYEQIRVGVKKALESDPIQSRITQAQDFAKAKAAETVPALVDATKTFVATLKKKEAEQKDAQSSDSEKPETGTAASQKRTS